MAKYTDRWGLSILGPGDSIQDDGFKFSDADRRLLDRLLTYAAEHHHHTGLSSSDLTPTAGPSLMLDNTGGAMPAAHRYYYRYTIIDDTGNESAASPMAPIDTPAAVSSPSAPTPTALTGTGVLPPGTYSYVFSAYAGPSTLESKAVNSAAIRVPGTNPYNSVSIILPDLPGGADGLNAYRKSPSGMHYLWITAIPAPTSGQIWIDDGAIEGDCDRSLPANNRTSGDNMVTVIYPGATPVVPDGWSWRIYRSTDPSDWGRSFLAELAPQGTPPVTPSAYPDVGGATQVGGPPAKAQVINAPAKINLTDGAEVQGELPPGRVIVPHIVTFSQPGIVIVGVGRFVWVCDYDEMDILSCRAYLGVGSVADGHDIIVDVNAYRPSQGSTTWESIYSDGPTRPRIPVGTNAGTPTVPLITHLEAGDALTVDCDQGSGGATPTASDLSVNILFYAKSGSADVSLTWEM
jgi:hypothetical protein